LAARIRRRDVSPVEVVDAFLQRIDARNPSLNAFVFLDPDGARKRAKDAERAVMSGEQLVSGIATRSAERTSTFSRPGSFASKRVDRAQEQVIPLLSDP